nr:MAG TPA: Cytosine specific methyltransferase [Caudoviricetes sp.]
MKVLSLFDGMSCGQIALRELGVPIDMYYASEIDKHAIAQTQLNFPETIQLGDVEKWREWNIEWEEIDLLLAGSPCQGFSLAGKMLGHDDPRSMLYWVFLDILHHVQKLNPNVKYLLENVRMRPSDEARINESLGIRPVVINSALVSAQNRVRLYWSNIRTKSEGIWGELLTDIPQPADRGIYIGDILDDEVDEKYYMRNLSISEEAIESIATTQEGKASGVVKLDKKLKPKAQQDKASCLTAVGHSGGNHSDMYILYIGIFQRGRSYLKSRVIPDKSPTLTSNSWSFNNMECATVLSVGSLRFFGGVEFRRMKTMKSPCLNAQSREDGNNQPVVELAVGTWRTHKVDGGFREIAGGKAPCIPARARNDGSGQPVAKIGCMLRRLTPTECARLQTIPDWYKWVCSDTQAYKMLGNGWTVEVIKHILSHIIK